MQRYVPSSSPTQLAPRPPATGRVVVRPPRPRPSRSTVAADLDDLRFIGEHCLASRQRDGVYLYFNALNNVIANWQQAGQVEVSLHECLGNLNRPVRLNYGEAYAILIYCSCPDVADKTRSKWARALRYADEHKQDDETIAAFMMRKGGINACTALYARQRRKR